MEIVPIDTDGYRGEVITNETIRYSILDPTGNITALVESAVPVDRQPDIAAEEVYSDSVGDTILKLLDIVFA